MAIQNQRSRTKNVMISTVVGIIGYCVTYILSFVYRTVFIHSLGETYLGVQGLFSNILSMLSLAELGISTAITFSLYKPIANNDQKMIRALMVYFKNAYRIIAVVVGTIGLILVPFLNVFVKEKPDISEPLVIIYLLYLSNTVVSYLLVYRQALIRADQRVYIISLVNNVVVIVRTLLQIVWLEINGTFLPVLIIQLTSTILENLILYFVSEKLYPYLKEKTNTRLPDETRTDITKKISAMFLHKISGFVIDGTDNMLISKLIGIATVGLYSNYLMLISMVKKVADYFIKAVSSGIGNYVASKNIDESRKFFFELNFLLFWFYSLCTVLFAAMFTPFITWWIGDRFLLDSITVGVVVLNFFLFGMHQIQLIYRNVLGLYVYCKWKPVAESVLNILFSIVFARRFGLVGIFMGTAISNIMTTMWVEPYVLFKYYFSKGLLDYWKRYLLYIIATIVSVTTVLLIRNLIKVSNPLLEMIIVALTAVVLHTLWMLLFFARSTEFHATVIRFKSLLAKILRR